MSRIQVRLHLHMNVKPVRGIRPVGHDDVVAEQVLHITVERNRRCRVVVAAAAAALEVSQRAAVGSVCAE